MDESKEATQEVLEAMDEIGFDGREFEEDIERAFDRLLDGNWKVGAMLGDRRLCVINSDEYSQHMSGPDRPSCEDQLCFVACADAYVWLL